jgi:sugar (pentulose or hexulose) kinase
VLAGVRLEHDGLALLRGTLAGVAMRVADCVEALAEAGAAPAVVRASGRLSGLAPLSQLLADATGLPVAVMAEGEAGLRGAARLAAIALAGEPGAAPPGVPALPSWPLVARARREPRWDAARRLRARSRWRAFAAAAAAALPPPEGP